MGSIARYREAAAARARKLADIAGSSHTKAATSGAIVVAAAAAGGALDAKVGEVQGVKPSIGAGIALAAAGLATRSPRMINAATGLLAPHAYTAAYEWASDDEVENDAENAEEMADAA